MKNQVRLAAILSASILLVLPASSFGQASRVKLNQNAFAYAKGLIARGNVVMDKISDWHGHHPTVKEEDEFIRAHGIAEYAKWHLGIDEAHAGGTKVGYKFPFGDFKNVYRSGLLAVKSRAHQFGYSDIENAANQLLELIASRQNTAARSEHRLLVCAPGGRRITPPNPSCSETRRLIPAARRYSHLRA